MDADVRQMAERCAASEGGFARMTYTEAVDVLAAAVASGKADFAFWQDGAVERQRVDARWRSEDN